MNVDFANLIEALTWLAAPASAMAWAIAVSDFYRNQPWMAGLEPWARQAIVLASQIVPPVGAHIVLLTVPRAALDAAAPHFALAASVAIAVLASRGVFELTKNRGGAG
jgi:hypothetical protein